MNQEACNSLLRKELAELVSAAQSGDPGAFESIVSETENLVRKLSYPIVGRNLVDDALQETYLAVFRNINQLSKPEAFLGWLSRMTLHVCYEICRKNPQTQELDVNSGVPDESERVSNKLTLQQALQRLERQDRDLLILRELLNLSYEELAYTLRLPIGTIKSRLYKARQKLKERLTLGSTHQPSRSGQLAGNFK